MKKNKLTFVIATSFLALSALVGCDSNEPSVESKAGVESNITTSELINPSSDGGNSQSSNGGNSNSSTSQGGGNTSQGGGNTSQGGGTSDKTDWTDSEKATMRGALHGLVLPFVNMEATVRTNNDGSSVKIESQQNMSGNFLATYAEKFTYEDGWNGGDVSSEFGVSNGNAFAYQKAVTESGKKYYVSVMFMGIEQTAGSEQFNISKTGRFYLEATDPYEYEYPAAFIGQWLGQQFNTSIVPPSFDAEYYNLDSEGVLIGYSERNIEESYKSALLSSGNFTIDSARNDDGFLIARPTDGSYIMLFKYDGTNKIMILQVIENNGWSAGKISAFYRKYNQTPLEFPALNVDGASYRFVEDEGNANYAAIGNLSVVNAKYIISKTGLTNAPLANYVSALRSAGYAVTVFDESSLYLMKAIADGVYYSASIDYSASPIGGGKPQIVMNFYATGLVVDGLLASWPATQLRTFFGNEITDALPAFTGNNCGFKIAISGDVAVIDINVDAEVSATIKDSYAGLLSTNEYSPESNKYISKNNQLEVRLSDPQGYGLYDIFQIRVEKLHGPVATPWPASEIAQAMASNLPSVTDTIPEIDVSTADECTVNDNLTSEISIYIGGGDIPLNDIKTTFRNAGWIEDAYYDYDFSLKGGFVSPNRQVIAHIQQLSEAFEISIKGYFAQDYSVVGVNNVWDYNLSEIVFNNATDPEEVNKGYYQTQLKATFSVVSGDKFKVTNGIEWYGIETVEEGVSTEDFAYDTDGNIVAVKAGEVNLYFKTMSDGSKKIYIAYVSETPTTEPWPEDAINAYFGNSFDYIPEIKIAGASFEIVDPIETSEVREYLIRATGDNIAALLEAAINDCLVEPFNYDTSDEIFTTDIENYPVYAVDVENNDSILIYIIEIYDVNSWAHAKGAFEEDQTDITLPDLQVDGAISYAYNGSIDIKFADDANMQDMFSAVCIKLESQGYHYSQRFLQFVNTTTDLGFVVSMSETDEHTVCVTCSGLQSFEADTGYGIILIGYDSEGGYYYLNTEEIGSPNPEKTNEYMVLEVEFSVGDRFCIYDFTNETEFNVTIDETSLGSNFRNYFEYDSASGSYLVKQAFTGDIYIKLIYGGDQVYIGFTPNP